MRFLNLAFSLSLLLALIAPSALLRAQFQPPSDEELKMTDDPKAPGASAVYLYREDVTDDFNHFHSYFERIKILTEKGKDLATIHIPYLHGYDSVNDIQGRTIHADGSIVPLNAKPADLTDYKVKDFQVNTIVFTLPAVEVGSILEYRLKVREPDETFTQPTWQVQTPYFCHQAHFSYHPYIAPGHYIPGPSGGILNRLMYSQRLAADTKVNWDQSRDLYSLDLTDIPPVPEEDWMPPLNTIKWRVEFYYTDVTNSGAFWADAGKRWAKTVDEFTNPTASIKQAAADIVAATDTDQQKAAKIYAAVQKLDNTAFSRKRSDAERKVEKIKDIHKAEDVWRNQSGSDDDIALLFVSLARAAGVKVWPVQVVDRDRAIFDQTYLTARQLDDYLAIVEIDGKDVILDPGQKMCPFELLAWKHTLASGFRLTANGAANVLTPAGTYKTAGMLRIADLTLDPTGNVTGSARFTLSGPDALHWRQLALENDPNEVKKQFNEFIRDQFPDGIQPEFDHFLGMDDYNLNLIGAIKVTGVMGTATGKRYFLPGLFFASRSTHPFVTQDKRATPIDVQYAKTMQDDVTYHLPPGFSPESAPQSSDASWPNHAMLRISSRMTGDSVEVVRTLVYNFALLDPKEYPNLHDFYQKVATADQQQLVLTRSQAVKGN
jgi:transglutaminase-like putative cysteine protease